MDQNDAAVVSTLSHFLAQAGTVPALIEYTEELELDLVHSALSPAVACLAYKAQLIAYLIVRDLDAARFLWKRLPLAAKTMDAELVGVWAIGKFMWTGKRTEALRACGPQEGGGWSPQIAPAVAQLREALRAHSIALIGQHYAALTVADAAAMLDIAPEQLLAIAAEQSWQVRPGDGGGTLEPRPMPTQASIHEVGMGQLAQLTHLVAQLD